MSIARVTADLTAGDSFSAPVRLRGRFNFVLSGGFAAAVRLQRSFADPAGSADWHDIPDAFGNALFSGPVAMVGEEPEGAWYRFGIASGGYTSGTASGRISQ